jgi:hypothetical protein
MIYQHGVGKTLNGFDNVLPQDDYLKIMKAAGDLFKNNYDNNKTYDFVLDKITDPNNRRFIDFTVTDTEYSQYIPKVLPAEETEITFEDEEFQQPTQATVADIPQNKVSGIESFGSTVTANSEVIKALGANPHSIDMIEAGFRTRTTRSESEMSKYAVKVGDIIKHFGKSADGTTKNILARVTAIHPKGTPGFKGTWNKEGWRAEDVNVIDRFKDGAAAIEFEVIKPTQAPGLSENQLLNKVGDIITRTSKLKYKTVTNTGTIRKIEKTENGYNVTLNIKGYDGGTVINVIIENGKVIKSIQKNPLKVGEFLENTTSTYDFKFSEPISTQPTVQPVGEIKVLLDKYGNSTPILGIIDRNKDLFNKANISAIASFGSVVYDMVLQDTIYNRKGGVEGSKEYIDNLSEFYRSIRKASGQNPFNPESILHGFQINPKYRKYIDAFLEYKGLPANTNVIFFNDEKYRDFKLESLLIHEAAHSFDNPGIDLSDKQVELIIKAFDEVARDENEYYGIDSGNYLKRELAKGNKDEIIPVLTELYMATPKAGYYLKNILSEEQFKLLESILSTQPTIQIETKAETIQEPGTVASKTTAQLPLSNTNIAKVLDGSKVITTRTELIADDTYLAGDTQQVKIKYYGIARVVGNSVVITNEKTNKSFVRSKDSFAKAEGFKNWSDYTNNNRFMQNFIKGDATRYVFGITPAGKIQQMTTVQQRLSPENNPVIGLFNEELARTNGVYPKEFIYESSEGTNKYVLSENNLYNLVDIDTGSIYLRNIDLTTGNIVSDILPQTPVGKDSITKFINTLNSQIKEYRIDLVLANKGIDVNDIIDRAENVNSEEELNELRIIINKNLC